MTNCKCKMCEGHKTICELNSDGYVIAEEKCPICGDTEPCSHDFNKENEELETIARRMGENNGR